MSKKIKQSFNGKPKITQSFNDNPIIFEKANHFEVLIEKKRFPKLFKHAFTLVPKTKGIKSTPKTKGIKSIPETKGIKSIRFDDKMAYIHYNDYKVMDAKIQKYVEDNPSLQRHYFQHNGVVYVHKNELILELSPEEEISTLEDDLNLLDRDLNLEASKIIGQIIRDEDGVPICLVKIVSGSIDVARLEFEQKDYVTNAEVNFNSSSDTSYERSPMRSDYAAWDDVIDLPENIVYNNLGYESYNQELIGDNEIRICLMDNGVYEWHEDIQTHFDEARSWNFVDNDPNQTPNRDDYHGTWCAGILAASRHHNHGLDGIGNGAGLVSYRIAAGSYDGVHISNFNLIRAFYTATDLDDCHVINCSWTLPYESELLSDAITYAATKGRNGLGIPIVIAAGNYGEECKFPATHKDVIAVSAVNLVNLPVGLTGLDTWQTSYGDNILLAAPGKRIITTDIPDGIGRTPNIGIPDSTNNGHYLNYIFFEGTSAAAPIVAGCIAKILNHKSTISLNGLRDLLSDVLSLTSFPHFENPQGHNYGDGILHLESIANNLITNPDLFN